MHSARARDSILGHTHILWSENGDVFKKGEVPGLGSEGGIGQTGKLVALWLSGCALTFLDRCSLKIKASFD